MVARNSTDNFARFLKRHATPPATSLLQATSWRSTRDLNGW
jgi:hypothetical protein